MKADLVKNLSVCIVIRNEEIFIDRCLSSLGELADEILVVHDGECTDASLEICKNYKAKIFVRKFLGNAEPHRAWIYEKAESEWILQLDADEFLSDELRQAIPKLVKDKMATCYELLCPYWNGKQYVTKNWPWIKRLFRKSSIKYLAIPHEEVKAQGKIIRLPLCIHHQPNHDNFSWQSFVTKHRRTAKVHARFFLEDKKNWEKFPAGDQSLLPHYYVLAKHDLLVAPFIFVYHMAASLAYGAIWEGFYGWRNAFLFSLYYLVMAYEIRSLKKNVQNI